MTHSRFLRVFLFPTICLLLTIGSCSTAYALTVKKSRSGAIRTITRLVPVPVAGVDGDVITYRDVLVLSSFLPNADDRFDRALEKRADQIRLERIAKEVSVTPESSFRSEDIQAFLDRTGVSKADFERYIDEPYALALALTDAVKESEELQSAAKKRVQQLFDDLELGIPFQDLAVAYSEDGRGFIGGNLGYIGTDDYPEIVAVVEDLSVGEISDIFEEDQYFGIAELYDVAGEGDDALYGVRVIRIEKDDLEAILDRYRVRYPTERVLIF